MPLDIISTAAVDTNDESYAAKMATDTAVKLCWRSKHETRIPSPPKRTLLLLHPLEQAIKTSSFGDQRVKTTPPYNLADGQKH